MLDLPDPQNPDAIEGFSYLESRGPSSWRWALGQNQRVAFTPGEHRNQLQYSFFSRGPRPRSR